MLFSLMVAFVVSPWAALRLLRGHTWKACRRRSGGHDHGFYRKLMGRTDPKHATNAGRFWRPLLCFCFWPCSLVALKAVRVKMLPFENKSEFQVIVDMPEGTPLERTLSVEQEIGAYLHTQPEILNYQTYAGISGPYNFNGLVRHYYLRRGANQGDIQVNLRPLEERKRQSHELAKEMRGPIQEIAKKMERAREGGGSSTRPSRVSTLVAEVYGPDYQRQIEVARQIRKIFDETPASWTSTGTSWRTRRNSIFRSSKIKPPCAESPQPRFLNPLPWRWEERRWDCCISPVSARTCRFTSNFRVKAVPVPMLCAASI